MLAIIKTGGKQYVVKPGSTLKVEKLSGDVGSVVSLPEVLLVAEGDDHAAVKIATGTSLGAASATVLEQDRADKVRVIKFKPKVRYRRIRGHRQAYTKIRIEGVTSL